MAMVTTLTANNTLGDASFSSYLNGTEETFVVQLTKSSQNSSIPISCHIPLGRNKPQYGEIDVFSAERYFNEPLEEQEVSQRIMNKRDEEVAAESLKRNIRPATPSIRSESSWNSRSLLLNVPTPQRPPKGNSSWRGKNFLASLGCYCSCNDDNAIDVSSHAKGANNGHINKFGSTNSNIWLKEERAEFLRRKSEGIFESPRGVKLIAWDAIPPRGVEMGTPKCHNGEYNDTNSESSSDLFEIESLSTNYTNPYLVRQASDVRSGCITPTGCYPPSEASVQWSTVTASMADFSVMSDSEEFETVPARPSRSRKASDERNRQMTNKIPGILSSCKNHKAVRVTVEAHRTTDKGYSDLQRQQRMQIIKPMRRFQTENKLTGLNTTNSHRFNTLSLS